LDIHTLHVEHAVFLAMYALLTAANSWLYKGMKGVYWFCAYSLFVLLGAIGVALRGQVSNPASILAGTVFVSLGYAALYLCIRDFFNRKGNGVYVQLFLLVVMTAAMLQYGVFTPDTRKRLLVYSLILFLQQAQTAMLLLRNTDTAIRIPTTSMAVMVLGLVASNFLRTIGVSIHGAPQDYLNAGSFLIWVLIVNTCLQAGIMIAYVWMTAAMLRGKLEVQAATDPLTGALNRRGIEIAAEQRILACRRENQPLSAAVIDLDDFKRINDTYGHHCGDATLIAVSSCLQRGIRSRDLLARIGGDEFAILLPNTSQQDALEIVERLRTAIAETDIIYGQIRTRVSASFGVAQLQPNDRSWEHLFLSCDKLLYDEKRSERSQGSENGARARSLEILPH
jgi:diguanylate cyclase (GGDEF)-like protein